jgi:hypothetical protein
MATKTEVKNFTTADNSKSMLLWDYFHKYSITYNNRQGPQFLAVSVAKLLCNRLILQQIITMT